MNENEFELAARAWLDEGPTHMSDHAVLSALEEIHATRQRRAMWRAWTATPVSIFARVALAAAIVMAVGLVAGNVIRRQSDPLSVGVPSASPSAQKKTLLMSEWNGFSMRYPEEAAVTPATNRLGMDGDAGFDIVETHLGGIFKGTSIEAPDDTVLSVSGRSIDDWIDAFVADYAPGCSAPRSEQASITIDGRSGKTSECGGTIDATVLFGGRIYLFTLQGEPTGARAVFDAFASTIDLTPETAVDYPSPDSTFVSPTNGFSFDYFDRGGLVPAKQSWDPLTQPQPDHSGRYDGAFDVVDTGYGAVFKGASTPIPAGVSIDAWVDEHLRPGFCGVSRSQQAEITIDGHRGRIQECADQIDATVVAGGRLYLFTMMHSRPDARAWFDAFVATVRLTPDTAAAPTATPSS